MENVKATSIDPKFLRLPTFRRGDDESKDDSSEQFRPIPTQYLVDVREYAMDPSIFDLMKPKDEETDSETDTLTEGKLKNR